MAQIKNDNRLTRAPKPVDDRTGFWLNGMWRNFGSVAAALADPDVINYRYPSMTIPINDGVNPTVEYWFDGGVTDSDFKIKTADLSGLVPYTGATGNVNLGANTITAGSLIKTGGSSDQFLKADGSVDSTNYAPQSALSGYQLLTQKNQANGYAGLDTGAKIFTSQLPDSILGALIYQGTWDAATNTPTLVDPPASSTKGYFYVTDTPGTQFGLTFAMGDWIVSNGSEWQKVDNTDAVVSVFGRIGNVLANEADYNAFYPLLSGAYVNPSWITSLPYSKITGTPNLSVYELLANKQNSLSPDDTGIKYSTVDAVNKRTPYVTPEEYGAVGDGIVDDSDAIIACLAANDRVHFSKSYKVSKDLPIRTGHFIYSSAATITRTSTTGGGSLNVIIDAQSVDNWSMQGNLTLMGSGNSDSGQSGLRMQLCNNFKVSGLTVKDVAGSGLNFSGFGSRGNGGMLDNISLQNNWVGAYFNGGAEYYTITNINASQNTLAINILGGNNSIIGGSISDNVNGIYIGGPFENNSHGVLSGLNVNHNTGYNLKAENVEFGESIIGCHFYATVAELGVQIVNSKGIVFEGCTFDGFLSNSDSNSPKGTNVVSACLFEDAFSFSGDPLVFRDCYTKIDGMSPLNNDVGRFTKNLTVITGTSGITADLSTQQNGSIEFGNSSGANTVPTIVGKSNDRTGLTLTSGTNDINSDADFVLTVNKNDNSDFTTLTSSAFKFLRYETTLIDVLRNGNTAFTGNVTANSFIKSGGTSSQFLKADGSVDGNTYGAGTVTSVTSANTNISVANSTTTPVLTLAPTISSNTTGNAATATALVVPDNLQSVTDRGNVTTNLIKVTGQTNFQNGNGLELFHNGTAIIQSYDRGGTNTYQPMIFSASSFNFNNGNAAFSGNVTASTAPTIGGHLTNKTYVDGLVSGKANLAGGNSFTGGQLFLNGTTTAIITNSEISMSDSANSTAFGMNLTSGLLLNTSGNGNGIIASDNLTAQRVYQMADVSGTSMTLSTDTAPTTSASTGKTGTVIISGGFRYECIATNSWVRSAVSTF